MANTPVFGEIDIKGKPNKASPVNADLVLIEDSEANYLQKNVTIETLKSAAGVGDVDGPASATDNAIARWNLATGKLLQDSVVIVGDTGNITGLGTLNTRTIANWVDGPATSADNTIPRFDLTTGKLLQASGIIIDDSNNILIPGTGGLTAPTHALTLGATKQIALYETYTDASNYEAYVIDPGVTTADTLTIAALSAGTGSANLGIALTPKGTGTIKVPTGTVTNPIIVSDDADSGFYFGSKGFNWGVDGVNKFSVSSTGIITAVGLSSANIILPTSGYVTASAFNNSLLLQNRDFGVAGDMTRISYGITNFTGFDGEIVGVNIMPTVGVLDDGDTMTLLKLSPTGTPASTLGIMRCLTFGNWGGTGTDTAYMIDMTATGYDGVLNVTADATDPTGGGGAAAGRIPILVGGVVKYLAYY